MKVANSLGKTKAEENLARPTSDDNQTSQWAGIKTEIILTKNDSASVITSCHGVLHGSPATVALLVLVVVRVWLFGECLLLVFKANNTKQLLTTEDYSDQNKQAS